MHSKHYFNPFNAPLLHPLKISENRKVFRRFEGVEKKHIGKNGLITNHFKDFITTHSKFFSMSPKSHSQLQYTKNEDFHKKFSS